MSPGCGLSGSTERADLVQLELEVLRLVASAVGADRFDLIGASFGAPLAVRWAARHPESVSRLILYGGWVDGDAVAAPEPASLIVWGGLGALGLAAGYVRKNRKAKA